VYGTDQWPEGGQRRGGPCLQTFPRVGWGADARGWEIRTPRDSARRHNKDYWKSDPSSGEKQEIRDNNKKTLAAQKNLRKGTSPQKAKKHRLLHQEVIKNVGVVRTDRGDLPHSSPDSNHTNGRK